MLLTGDNVEPSLPYLYWDNLDGYVDAQEEYLKLEAKRVIAGHIRW